MKEKHIISAYDQEIADLIFLIRDMASGMLEILEICKESIENKEKIDQHAKAKLIDKRVNNLDLLIEENAMNLLALWQPVASDLRKITGAIRMAVILERMGDLGKNTCKRLSKAYNVQDLEIKNQLSIMTTTLINNFKILQDCLEKNDQNLAEQVIINDLEINKMHKILFKLISHAMTNYPLLAPDLLQILLAVKNIERLGDYVVKIAKIIYFIETGQIKQKKDRYEK